MIVNEKLLVCVIRFSEGKIRRNELYTVLVNIFFNYLEFLIESITDFNNRIVSP